ncbi:hypothetical protein B0H13DRAFT_1851034 [Mycena leptocephala]|nr:hypothetical protein B0H13DRAFT_1851034 [Mycena leptocephala]
MRTPLTGRSGADVLGLQTPSTSTAGTGGMLRVTPTRESVATGAGGAGGNGVRRRRSVHPRWAQQEGGADDDNLQNYEAAVLPRKAPEPVLRKPARRPTTSAGVSGHHQQQAQQHQGHHHQGDTHVVARRIVLEISVPATGLRQEWTFDLNIKSSAVFS